MRLAYYSVVLRGVLSAIHSRMPGVSAGNRGFIRNVNRAPEILSAKRALFVYVQEPFLTPDRPGTAPWHQNWVQSRMIAGMLGERGYVVDVADWRTPSLPSGLIYDIVLSHAVTLPPVAGPGGKQPRRFYLATGQNHFVRNARLRSRLEALAGRRPRHGVNVSWCDESMPFVAECEAILCFGNEHTAATWRQSFHVPVHTFDNFGFPPPHDVSSPDAEARRHFLFFGSTQQLLKGLDLLLEVFSTNPELHLYVCARYHAELDFCSCYRRELFGLPNVHPVGLVRVHSDEYRGLTARCGYVILPSCSEGQSGGVVQCMHSGLIPIVTPDCGLDVQGLGVMIQGDDVSAVEHAVRESSSAPAESFETLRNATLARATRHLTQEHFLNRLRVLADALGV